MLFIDAWAGRGGGWGLLSDLGLLFFDVNQATLYAPHGGGGVLATSLLPSLVKMVVPLKSIIWGKVKGDRLSNITSINSNIFMDSSYRWPLEILIAAYISIHLNN